MKRIIIAASFAVVALIASIIWGCIELNKVRSTSVYQFQWNGHGWKVDHPETLPKVIESPYGFLHAYATQGRSYTLVVPHSWAGDKEVKVYFWDKE